MSNSKRNVIEDLPHNEFETANSSHRKSITCSVCNIRVTSSAVLMKHTSGKKHTIRVSRLGKTFDCDICKVVANSQKQLDAHLSGFRHKNELLKCYSADQNDQCGWGLTITTGIVAIFIIILIFLEYL